ncbi:MAG: hypothetical protein ACXVY5_05510, partial [Gaiellales bacterium]
GRPWSRRRGTEAMTDFTPTAADTAELEARNQSTAGRLFVAADAFLFLGFLFAYFYLRTLNSNGNWNPPGQDPSTIMGIVSLVLAVASAAAFAFAVQRLRTGGAAAFRPPALAALALAVALTVAQGVQLFAPGFSPNHGGGFGAVFIGFTAVYAVHLLGALYWLETLVVEQGGGPGQARAAAFALTWYYMVAVYAIFFLLFYVVI